MSYYFCLEMYKKIQFFLLNKWPSLSVYHTIRKFWTSKMKILINLEIFLLFSPFVFAIQPVHLELYYESLCPDCSGFIINQLLPTWNKLKNTSAAFTLSMFPFGKLDFFAFLNSILFESCLIIYRWPISKL